MPSTPRPTTQTRALTGHSHAHGHHHHDTTLLTGNAKDPGVRITRIGLLVNLGMALVKGTGGYMFSSKALTADAVHSLTDLLSDVCTLATYSYSLRPPSTRFPTGYGKIESLGALAISGILLTGGLAIGGEAVVTLAHQFVPVLAPVLEHLPLFGHSHSHAHGSDLGLPPNINAAWLAGGSILIKEALYRATMKVARDKRSSLLASNAYHHRVDSLTAFVALVSICSSHLLTDAAWLDPIGGLIISAMIIQAGWANTRSALLELADVSLDADIKQKIAKLATQAVADVEGASFVDVQGNKSGQNLLVHVALSAPKTWTLDQSARAESVVRDKISRSVRGVKRVTVRFVQGQAIDNESSAFRDEFVAFDKDIAQDASSDEEHEHVHDHRHKMK